MNKVTSFADFNKIYCNKYTVNELKNIGLKFNVKWKNKKKNDIQTECYTFLKNSYYVAKIQKLWRNYLIRIFNKFEHEAFLDQTNCIIYLFNI